MSETAANEARCRYGAIGLPSCLAGTRGERWWCKACADHAVIRWLVETLHYPFDCTFDAPPPVDHDRLADYWNELDGWGITPEEARSCIREEAGLTRVIPPAPASSAPATESGQA